MAIDFAGEPDVLLHTSDTTRSVKPPVTATTTSSSNDEDDNGVYLEKPRQTTLYRLKSLK